MRKVMLSSIILALGFSLSLGHCAEPPIPVQKAVQRLSQVLKVNVEAIEVVSYEFVLWPDSSLGVPRKDFGYLPVITGGYKAVLAHEGRHYVYHTDTKERVVLASSEPALPIHTDRPAESAGQPVAAGFEQCREDLAKRLRVKVEEITVAEVRPVTFTDGSLGLPRPGQLYTKALVSGHQVLLEQHRRQYLYAVAGDIFRYGGPMAAREYSALYVESVMNDPNLNGNLVQVALAGDNPRVVLAGVREFRPQPDGSIIAQRRTSRSGHELLYLAPKSAEPVTLAAAFAFGDAAVSRDGTRWATVVRPFVGGGWALISGPAGQQAEGEPVALPEGLPRRVYMHMTNPVVQIEKEGRKAYLELFEGHFRPISFYPPESEEAMLHKSASVLVDTEPVAGKPMTRVLSVWFTGDEKVLATIEGFVASEWSFSPNKDFILLSGKRGETHQAYTVEIRTGEVLETVAEADGPVRLLPAPSAKPIVMSRN